MNNENQLLVLMICMFSGVLTGILTEIFSFVRLFVKGKVSVMIIDSLIGISAAFIFFIVGVLFYLPDFRLYMAVGILLGFWFYHESLHRILAILEKRLYNKCRSCLKRIRIRQAAANERRKAKKNSSRRDRGGSNTVRDLAGVLDLSADRRVRTKTENKRTGKTDRIFRKRREQA